MVARINIGKSIRGALSYNEKKVYEGKAELLLSSHFSCEVSDLGFSNKLNRFQKITDLRPRSKTNCLHISLNFSPTEELDNEKMQLIARDYMEQIGFGNQPYLVYRHKDAGHPHIHIVTTNITAKGGAIPLNRIGQRKSEPARKSIEEKYGLVKAEGQQQEENQQYQVDGINPVTYGKAETKKAISDIVRKVASTYKYTSMEEFNAVLRQYNVTAIPTPRRGNGKQGLVYSIVDSKGQKTGIPINASAIFTSPTIAAISRQFDKKLISKKAYAQSAAARINGILNKSHHPGEFLDRLRKADWNLTVCRNEQGVISDLYFINNRNKLVYTNSDLNISTEQLVKELSHAVPDIGNSPSHLLMHSITEELHHLIDILFREEYTGPDISQEFLRKKKKKRTT